MLKLTTLPLHSDGPKRETANLTERHYLNILQSMDQSVHIINTNAKITHWFRGAERLYGYTVTEAVGQNSVELLADVKQFPLANSVLNRVSAGETWSGQFPVKSKSGEKFVVIVTDSPLYDDTGTLFAIVCVSARATPFPKQPGLCPTRPTSNPRILVSLSNLASDATNKVRSKMLMTGEGPPSVFGVFVHSGSVHKKSGLQHARENKSIVAVNSKSQGSDYEILWEDLKIGGQIGHGCCGTVYRGLWNSSDVAIKVFSEQEFSDDLILSFKQEVSLLKRLRHPNILLFMGSVTSPNRLCIVTEFLPQGSLFQLLHKSKLKLDWKRRVHMALDIARGMTYLHQYNPPIVHRDLKSPNLLVDNNLNVKIGDFGLSRLKHETFIKTKTAKGTPQWMAPEVLRVEPSNEKSDVYSFGVILWELATQKIPWDDLHTMQVIGGVGFMDRRLDIPEDVDPQWAAMIQSCWQSDPKLRPTFEELLEKLKISSRRCVLEECSAPNESSSQMEL